MSRCRVLLRRAERPDHGEVDHELELGRQLDRQIARLFALEDAAGVDARQAMVLVGIRSIAHESARGSELEIARRAWGCARVKKNASVANRTLIAGIRSPKPVRFWLL